MAYEAARLLADAGGAELDRARRKAAARLGLGNRRCWPDNAEIQQALLQQQRLFNGAGHAADLAELRRQALAAMQAFEAFEPRLVGPALDGTATREQGVDLLLFADRPEDVVLSLLEQHIPWRQSDEAFRYAGGEQQTHPVLTFIAGEVPVSLAVLPPQARRNPPLSPVSEQPERGAGPAQVRALLEAGASAL
ncbi:hypothetical protein F2Q65_08525 [Thiohalocapsa marina]|uniref:Nucleotidyltransferase family protein n=1 Tax=Thiohalocapsa marina TaxID=424902 RepID=A0A5M8FLD7_9GAMM|nr:hypothetical protein F2Q65_08525 [Thiohalocapsa marina]